MNDIELLLFQKGRQIMSWAKNAAENIFPLSIEKGDLATALKEWRYTGEFIDLEKPEEDCHLCDHPNIRYQFEIGNLHTDNKLLIGSECINKFGIVAVDEEGNTLSSEDTRKKVGRDRQRLLEAARKKRIVTYLVALASKDTDFDILNFLNYVQNRGAFTPKQMSLLVWRLDKNTIQYNLRDFKIVITRSSEKGQLKNMPDWQLKKIQGCLSTKQKKWLVNNRHGYQGSGI